MFVKKNKLAELAVLNNLIHLAPYVVLTCEIWTFSHAGLSPSLVGNHSRLDTICAVYLNFEL